MARFLVNLGYRWLELPDVGGYIFSASGFNRVQGLNRLSFKCYNGQWLLFDPQLYLAPLDGDGCERTCAILATYPWFGIQTPEFDVAEMTQTEWFNNVVSSVQWVPQLPDSDGDIQDVVEECLTFQRDFCGGVTHLVAPAPLVTNAEDEFGIQLKWLNAALNIRGNYNIPILATVALSEYLLAHEDPVENFLLQSILDNLTTSEFDGLYVLIKKDSPEKVRFENDKVVQSLLFMSYMGQRSGKGVIVNYADDLGYACIAAGSVGFASGTTMKQRRLCFTDFIRRGGGSAYPRFYSHALVRDLLTETDLDVLRDAGLVQLIDNDFITEESEPLRRALQMGAGARSVPSWSQSRGNVSRATKHRLMLLGKVTNNLAQLSDDDRKSSVLRWLLNAEESATMFDERLKEPLTEEGTHIAAWKAAYDNMMDVKG